MEHATTSVKSRLSHSQVLELLSSTDSDGNNAICVAISAGNLPVVRYLAGWMAALVRPAGT